MDFKNRVCVITGATGGLGSVVTRQFAAKGALLALIATFSALDPLFFSEATFLTLANQVPAFFLHLPTTVFMVLPLTGWAGGLYFLLTFAAAVLRLLGVLLVARGRSSACQHAGGTSSLRGKLPHLRSLR